MGGAARRRLLHRGQLASHRGRGGLHRRRLRRRRHRVDASARRRRRRARREPRAEGAHAPAARRRARRMGALRRRRPVDADGSDRRRSRRRLHAVFVGHHRSTEGHQARAVVGAAGRRRARRVGPCDCVGPRRRQRVPVSRPALSLGSAGLVDERAAARRDGRRDGAVRPGDLLATHRAVPRDARAVRADDVRAHAQAAGRRARPLRRLEPQGRRARRRAVPCRRQAADDRVVGPDHLRVLLGDRGHGRDVHQLRGSAREARDRLAARWSA